MSENHENSEHRNAELSSSHSMSSGLESTELAKDSIDPKPSLGGDWITFGKEKSGIATIEPSHTIQVSSHSHPLGEDSQFNVEGLADATESSFCYEGRRSTSPKSKPDFYVHSKPTTLCTESTPACLASSPQIPKVLKSTTNDHIRNVSTQNVAQSFHNDLQSVPLTDSQTSRHSRGIRRDFSNGDIVVKLLPMNQKCAWVTKADFKPELVPEELMAQGLSLTVEDYVMAMQVLVNDVRFNMYIICYKRVLLVWIILGFIILLSILFSGIRGLALFGGGIVWLVINALGIFVCMWLKLKLYRMLERCMASVNALLYKQNLLLGLLDVGKISCHKINLIFIYFDVSYCLNYLKNMLENEGQVGKEISSEPQQPEIRIQDIDHSQLDIDTSDIIITGHTITHVSQKEKYAEKLLLRYIQRWVKEFVQKRLDLSIPLHGDRENGSLPCHFRHCTMARCPCQYIQEHLRFKPRNKFSFKELFV
ncbi:uncharacterized protein LOC143228834 isoform X1 [Tachypleus tridentatus]|uniref:uncharacterized protein LOC143228834 isoform X1 n=1 Tax=Tachypleus tridentatus TaxID=6853 RepID=UPI003FCFE651